MSYPPQPPSGFPQYPQQPGPGGWSGASSGQQAPQRTPPAYGQPPQQPGFGPPGGDQWGGPPKKSKTGLIVGLSAGAVLLVGAIVLATGLIPGGNKPGSGGIPINGRTTTAIPIPTVQGGTGHRTTPPSGNSAGDVPKIEVNGKAGDCMGQNAGTKVFEVEPCGSPTTILTVAKVPAGPTDCPKGYSVAESPTGYYCLTFDLHPGDCADAANLKLPCSSPQAVTKVLAVQPGPRTPNTCQGLGATKSTFTGPDPAQIACLGAKA